MQRARMPVGHAVYTGFTFQSPGSKREANSSRSEEHFQGAKPIPGAVYANIGNVHSWENHPDTAIQLTNTSHPSHTRPRTEKAPRFRAHYPHMHHCRVRYIHRRRQAIRPAKRHASTIPASHRYTCRCCKSTSYKVVESVGSRSSGLT